MEPSAPGDGRNTIGTARLGLVPCEGRHFESILAGSGRLGPMLGATVPEGAFDFPGVASIETVRYFHERLKKEPGLLGWWLYLFVHVEDGVLIGQGGYKGRPDGAGMVEIGYAISPAYRRRGLATEAAQGLIDHAFAHDRVSRVDAHTLAERNASTKVLRKAGMEFVETTMDPRHGRTWRWSVQRSNYGGARSSARCYKPS